MGIFLMEITKKLKNILKQQLRLKPDDPVIMDHYGDILWYLGSKIQANYFWKNVLIRK